MHRAPPPAPGAALFPHSTGAGMDDTRSTTRDASFPLPEPFFRPDAAAHAGDAAPRPSAPLPPYAAPSPQSSAPAATGFDPAYKEQFALAEEIGNLDVELPEPPGRAADEAGEPELSAWMRWIDSAGREPPAATPAAATPPPTAARHDTVGAPAAGPPAPANVSPEGSGTAEDALAELAERLEGIAATLRTATPEGLLAPSDDPLALLISGYALGYAQGRSRSVGG